MLSQKKQEKIEICSCIHANLSCFCTFFAQLSTFSCGTNTQPSQIALNRTLNDYLGTMYEKKVHNHVFRVHFVGMSQMLRVSKNKITERLVLELSQDRFEKFKVQ
jgi:amino acid permease